MKKLLENNDELCIWYGNDRRVVVYPCENNELLNFVCIHPEGEVQDATAGMKSLWPPPEYPANDQKAGVIKLRWKVF